MFGSFSNNNTQQQGQNPANPGGSIFGNPAQNPNQPSTSGTSLFGNPSQPAQGGNTSLFGSTTQTGNTGGGMFGGSTTNQTGGGLFGNASNQQQQQQQQQQPASGGMFGNPTSQQQPAPGGLFGNPTAPQQPTGSLFGGATNPNQQQQQQPTGGLFGGNTTQSQPSGGLFGSTTNQQPSGGGLFGGSTTQQPSGGGLFGGSTAQHPASGGGLFSNTAQQPATGGGLFGNATTQAPTTGGLFGNTQQPAGGVNPLFGNKNPASLFGGQTQQPSGAPAASGTNSTSLFGQSTTQQQQQQQPNSFFAQAPQQQQQQQQQLQRPAGSLFGSTNASTTTGSLFGSTMSSSLLSSRAHAGNTAQQQVDVQSQFTTLTQRIEGIARAWDSNVPECRFQHYFYNLVDPNQVSLYGRPPNATNEALWQKAVRENPDPTCLVPALAVGFDDLRQRADAQSQQASEQQEKLKELKKRLESLSHLHTDTNSSRLQRAVSNQSQLSHRLLRLIQHLHLLIPALRSSSIRPEEEALRAALEGIEEDIRRPGGMGKLRGKLNELWALVGAVNAARERGRKAGDGTAEWTVVDEDGLKQITQILGEQQAGLQHLTKVLQRNLKDLAVIEGKSTDEEAMDHSFSSTLRASAMY